MKDIKFNLNCTFWKELTNTNKTLSINGNETPLAYYNLILSIRDCKLYSKGIRISRSFKISDVKNYFGIKGNATQLIEQLEEIKEYIK